MLIRSQYRCSFDPAADAALVERLVGICREKASELIAEGKLCNVSFYRYENMGFLYVEAIRPSDNVAGNVQDRNSQCMEAAEQQDLVRSFMALLEPVLLPWPCEEGMRFFVPMINVYYHHIPDKDLDVWEHERTTAVKTRIGRIAFVFPDKLPSYVMHHTAIVNEGLWKGDKYAYISLHENILFSYYEEPRNNVNIRNSDEASKAIKEWMKVDPESHFDRVKAKGDNFLVIPCLFTVDRIDG